MLSLIGATVGFGVIPIFLKHFADTEPKLDAWTVNGVRYSVGALFWLPFLLVLDRRPAAAGTGPAPRNVWRDAAVPSIVNVIGQACFGLSAYYVKASTPKPMYQAMRNARQAIANSSGDHRTWGAYQHYGNPYFRLFAEVSSEQAVHEERDIHDGR